MMTFMSKRALQPPARYVVCFDFRWDISTYESVLNTALRVALPSNSSVCAKITAKYSA